MVLAARIEAARSRLVGDLKTLKQRAWPFGGSSFAGRTVDDKVISNDTSPNSETAHLQLLSFQDVTITSTRLTGSRRDDGEQSTLLESALQSGLDLGVLLSLSQDSLNVVGLLLLAFSDGGVTLGGLGTLEDGGSVLEIGHDEYLRSRAIVRSNSREPRTTA